MTTARLESLCLLWQDRLKLTHWTVQSITLKPTAEMGGEDGHNDWYLEDHTCKITIDRRLKAYDVQRTLVHELVHLRLARWPTAVYNDPHLEESVWALTDAFLAAYHVHPPKPRARRTAAAAARRRLRLVA
jgi:nitric oxide reductase activation protein